MLKEQSQSLDNFEIRLANIMQSILTGAKQNFQLATAQIYQSSALQRYGKHEDRLNSNLKSLNSNIKNLIDRKKLMLESILDLKDREVHEVMIHRKDIFSLNINNNNYNIFT